VAPAEDLPCADFGLLGLLKRSAEYGSIRTRVTQPKPLDAWRENLEHYFVFELRGAADATSTDTPYALFKMRWEDDGPVSAIVITPLSDGTHAEVRDLRWKAVAPYTVPLSAGGAEQDQTAKE
jgi:hypothetical protein